jgi:hypothetical protein
MWSEGTGKTWLEFYDWTTLFTLGSKLGYDNGGNRKYA